MSVMWLLSENLKVPKKQQKKKREVAPCFQMESQDPLKGCAFVNMGHGWKHNFCLSEGVTGAFLQQSPGHTAKGF